MQIAVVGAGILGLAVARELQGRETDFSVTVLDKEDRIARHQTSHNSGVAHAGVYYSPGSLKATLCRRGIGLLKDYCAEHGIPYHECGKLIVARDASELDRLDEIERRATANAVPGLRRLGPDGIRDIEPHVRGVAALHSPRTAIVDFTSVALGLAGDVNAAGGTIRLGFEVVAVAHRSREVALTSSAGEELVFDAAVLCPGLQADRLARLAGDPKEPAIVPFRGEYHRLLPNRAHLVRGLIYPVPDPAYPFLGVHFTRRIDGGVDIGPNAILALAREGYRRRDVSLRDTATVLAWPGFRRLARRHWRTGLWELEGSLSRRAFVARARSFIPELSAADVEAAPAGVRAQAVDRDGSLVDDFRIGGGPGVVTVRNAPSPGATSALAIAEHLRDEILVRLGQDPVARADGGRIASGLEGERG
jgi:L-2-hydroxyglutarate oxidase LhgO